MALSALSRKGGKWGEEQECHLFGKSYDDMVYYLGFMFGCNGTKCGGGVAGIQCTTWMTFVPMSDGGRLIIFVS